MKKLVARTLIAFLLGVLTLGSTAEAQFVKRVIKTNIPFEFSVGNQIFPAGDYSLVSQAPAILELRDAEGRTLVKLLTNSVETQQLPASPKLEFISEAGRFSLSQVWQENSSIGQQLQPPRLWAKKRVSGKTQTVAARNSH